MRASNRVQKLVARPQSAVKPLQTASETAMTPLRLVESAMRATGMPKVQ